MKLGELIVELQKHDPDTLVLVSGYEGDYESSIVVLKEEVHYNKHSSYFGDYEEWDSYSKKSEPKEPFTKAVIIARS